MTGWKRCHVTEMSNFFYLAWLTVQLRDALKLSIVTQQTLEAAAEGWMVASRGVY